MNGLSIPVRYISRVAGASCRALALLAALSLVLVAGSALAGRSPSETTVLATVDGEALTVADLNELLATQPSPGVVDEVPAYLSPDGLIQRLIQNLLLEQEGYRIEAEKRAEVRNQVWDLTRHKGMLALLDSVSADAFRYESKELEEVLQQTNLMQRVSQILLRDEATARTMIDSLNLGVPFADLAARHSVDTTEVIGPDGDIGWVRADFFIPEFANALADLTPGEFSEPFRTEVGWHVLQLTDVREETVGQSDAMVEAVREQAKAERVQKTVRGYVESLKQKYGVVVDSTLLASLDFGSQEPGASAALLADETVLAKLGWRDLTVRELAAEIRFKHFHGLAGKPDAAELRDKVFDEWIAQLLLRHEAGELGFDRRPALLREAAAFERKLVREAVLNMVLQARFSPDEGEVVQYYEDNIEDFAPSPRVRVDGVFVSEEAVARTLQDMLGQGARMSWLAANTPEVVDPKPAFLAGWVVPSALNIPEDQITRGRVVDPVQLGDVWAVAQIVEVEPTEPKPLEDCRPDVLKAMRAERRAQAVRDAITRLESEAEIKIEKDAAKLATVRVEAWLGIPVDERQP